MAYYDEEVDDQVGTADQTTLPGRPVTLAPPPPLKAEPPAPAPTGAPGGFDTSGLTRPQQFDLSGMIPLGPEPQFDFSGMTPASKEKPQSNEFDFSGMEKRTPKSDREETAGAALRTYLESTETPDPAQVQQLIRDFKGQAHPTDVAFARAHVPGATAWNFQLDLAKRIPGVRSVVASLISGAGDVTEGLAGIVGYAAALAKAMGLPVPTIPKGDFDAMAAWNREMNPDVTMRKIADDPWGTLGDPRWWSASVSKQVPFLVALGAAGAVGGEGAAAARLAALGESLFEGGSTFSEAKQAGASDEQAALVASVVSVLNYPMLAFTNLPIFEGRSKSYIKQVMLAIASETSQEDFQQLLSNFTAKNTYEPTRDLMEGIPESTVLGAVFGGGAKVMHGKHVEPTLADKIAYNAQVLKREDQAKAAKEADAAASPDMVAKIEQALAAKQAATAAPAGNVDIQPPTPSGDPAAQATIPNDPLWFTKDQAGQTQIQQPPPPPGPMQTSPIVEPLKGTPPAVDLPLQPQTAAGEAQIAPPAGAAVAGNVDLQPPAAGADLAGGAQIAAPPPPAPQTIPFDPVRAAAMLPEDLRAHPLGTALLSIDDMTPDDNGLLPVNNFTADEQAALAAAGVAKTIGQDQGIKFEAYKADDLYGIRTAYAARRADENAGAPPPAAPPVTEPPPTTAAPAGAATATPPVATATTTESGSLYEAEAQLNAGALEGAPWQTAPSTPESLAHATQVFEGLAHGTQIETAQGEKFTVRRSKPGQNPNMMQGREMVALVPERSPTQTTLMAWKNANGTWTRLEQLLPIIERSKIVARGEAAPVAPPAAPSSPPAETTPVTPPPPVAQPPVAAPAPAAVPTETPSAPVAPPTAAPEGEAPPPVPVEKPYSEMTREERIARAIAKGNAAKEAAAKEAAGEAPAAPAATAKPTGILKPTVETAETPQDRLAALPDGVVEGTKKTPFQTIGLEASARIFKGGETGAVALEDVPFQKLVMTQPSVETATVQRYLAQPQTRLETAPSIDDIASKGKSPNIPLVYKMGDAYYVADGSHRAVAEWARGAQTFQALVVQVSEAHQAPGPPTTVEQAVKPTGVFTGVFGPLVEKASGPPAYKSREKLVEMPIADFLDLADEGVSEQKAAGVKAVLEEGKTWDSLPFLQYELRNGQAVVVGHEGRHRARELQRRGFTTMPVILRGDIRWSEQSDPTVFDYQRVWPTELRSQTGERVFPFPVSREQAGQGYAPRTDGVETAEGGEEPMPSETEPKVTARYTINDRGNIEVKFPSMPPLDILKQLKGLGFQWSTREKSWYAKNDSARRAALGSMPIAWTLPISETGTPAGGPAAAPAVTPPAPVEGPSTDPLEAERQRLKAERAELIRKLAKKATTELRSGVDPEMIGIMIDLVESYVKEGIVIFKQVAQKMQAEFAELGLDSRLFDPYLESVWEDMQGEKVSVNAVLGTATEGGKVGTGATDDQPGSHPPGVEESEPGTGEGPQTGAPAGGTSEGSGGDGQPGASGRGNEGAGGGDGAGTGDGRGGAGSGGGVNPTPAPAGGTPGPVTTDGNGIPGNYRITDDDQLGEGGNATRFKQNLAAIILAKQIASENRYATAEEQKILVKFSGWGGLRKELNAAEYQLTRNGTLTYDEYHRAFQSTMNAHYTSVGIIRLMWGAMRVLGFERGRVLEPSMGAGHFLGLALPDIKATQISGVELDSMTGLIAKLLYPQSKIQITGVEDAKLPANFFDLIISNVPFGKYGVADVASKLPGFIKERIHNYFFGKALQKVRPGGMIAFISTHGTMDANDLVAKSTRDYLNKQADFLGAVRLPDTAFKDNAKTEVITDIIFMRKRQAGEANRSVFSEWTQAEMSLKSDLNPEGIPISKYFLAHPEHVVGEMSNKGTMYGGEDTEISVKFDGDQQAFLAATAQALTSVTSIIKENGLGYSPDNITALTAPPELAPDEVIEQMYYIDDKGTLRRRMDGQGQAIKFSPADEKIIRSFIKLRDGFRTLIATMRSGESTEDDVTADRKPMEDAFDAFVKAHGFLHLKENARLMLQDPFGPAVLATEDWDPEKKEGTKAAIFTTRTVLADTKPNSAESPTHALTISLSETGTISWDRISELLGIPIDEAKDALKAAGRVFEQPDGTYATTERYLSGRVRDKLNAARDAAELDDKFKVNVDALEKVVPLDLGPERISAQLGAQWIPVSVVNDFIRHLGGVGLRAEYRPALTKWTVSERTKARQRQRMASPWTTPDVGLRKMVESTLNNKLITVRDRDGKTDPVPTLEAQQKQTALKDEFKRWVWLEKDRSAALVRLYNDTLNTTALATYDGSHLVLPGMSSLWRAQLRPHQENAIWRAILEGNTYLGHTMGAGKTAVFIATAMEYRRLGLAKKPIIVIPKQTLGDYAKFADYYPNARVLIGTKDETDSESRKQFMARIATGEWDAIIVTQQFMTSMPAGFEAWREYLQEQIEELKAAATEAELREIEELANEPDPIPGQKPRKKKKLSDLVKKIQSLETKMKEMRQKQAQRQDAGLSWEDLGIDMLLVDEAHEYRKMTLATALQQVAGVPTGKQSQRADDLYIKARQIHRATPGRNLVFGSGTPLVNSIAEMYILQKFLQPEALKLAGVDRFDAWASTFGDIVTKYELDVTNTRLQLKRRFSQFSNMNALIQMFRTVMDVMMPEDLKLPTPPVTNGEPFIHQVDAGAELKAFIQTLVERIKNLDPRDRVSDNMLKISTDGRKAALDLRLVSVEPGGHKLAVMAEKILETNKKWDDKRGTQLVFMEMGVPDKKDKTAFSPYIELRDLLVKGGMKPSQIAFIQEGTKGDTQRDLLMAKMRSGEVRVMIGPRASMGTGVNVQARLVALHHADPHWLPALIEQADGRGIRQGNKFFMNDSAEKIEGFSLDINHYVTLGSFDAFMWSAVARKLKAINSALRGNLSMDSIEEIGSGSVFNPAEIAAIASGSPIIIERMQLEQRLTELQVAAHAWERERTARQQIIASRPARIEDQKREIAAYEAFQEKYAHPVATVNGLTDVSDINAWLSKTFGVFSTLEEVGKARPDAQASVSQTHGTVLTIPIGTIKPGVKSADGVLAMTPGQMFPWTWAGQSLPAKADPKDALPVVLQFYDVPTRDETGKIIRLLQTDIVVRGIGQGSKSITIHGMAQPMSRTLQTLRKGIESSIADTKDLLAENVKDLEEAQRNQDLGFKYGEELRQVQFRLAEINAELGIGQTENEAPEEESIDDEIDDDDDDIDDGEGNDDRFDMADRAAPSVYRDSDDVYRDIAMRPDVDEDIDEDVDEDEDVTGDETDTDTARAMDPNDAAVDALPASAARPIPGVVEREINPLQSMELYELITSILADVRVIPALKNTMIRGFARLKGKGLIGLHPDLFKKGNERQLMRTLAHEIGHIIDWLPDFVSKRGNLLGRLATLRKYIKGTFTDVQGNVIKNSVIKKELKEVSRIWRPWVEADAPASFKKYRNSASELYADALSMLLVDPGRLQTMAPTFFRAFFTEMDAKPEVKAAYFELLDVMAGPEEDRIARSRAQIEGEDYSAGEKKALAMIKDYVDRHYAMLYNPVFYFRTQYIDKHAKVADLVKKAKAAGAQIAEDLNPLNFLKEFNYVGRKQKAWLDKNILPHYDKVIASGAEWKTVGGVLQYERILKGDRSELFNPKNMQPAAAQKHLDHLWQELTPEQRPVVRAAANGMRAAMRALVGDAFDEGMISQDKFDSLMKNPAYAPFQVIEYMETHVSWRIFKQVGTGKAINNPANALVLKALSTVRAIEKQKMTRSVVKFLDDNHTDEIQDADTEWDYKRKYHKPVEPQDKDKALIVYYVDGRLVGKYVDNLIGDSVNNASIGHSKAVMNIINLLTLAPIMRPVYTTFNMGFQVRNVQRDFRRFWKNTPALSLLKALKLYVESFHIAKVRAFGIKGDVATQREADALKFIQEAEEVGALAESYNSLFGRDIEETHIEEVFAQHGVKGYGEKTHEIPVVGMALRPFKPITNYIRNLGDLIEALPKIAGVKYFSEGKSIHDLDADQRSFIREKIGTPDLRAGGTMTAATNKIFLYSNATIQGMRSDLNVLLNHGAEHMPKLADGSRRASGVLWKTAASSILPKVLMAVAMMTYWDDDDDETGGVLGRDGILAKGSTEYERTNYTTIPIGWDHGQAITVRLPDDQFGQMIGALTWKALRFAKGDANVWKTMSQIADYSGGVIPSVIPTWGILENIGSMVAGQNPYDAFRGRNVLTAEEQKARDWQAWAKFAGWQFQQVGGASLWRFYVGERPTNKTLAQRVMDFPIPFIQPMIASTFSIKNYGETERLREGRTQVEQEEATLRRTENRAVEASVSDAFRNGSTSAAAMKAEAKRLANELYPDMPKAQRAEEEKGILKKLRMGVARGSRDEITETIMGATSNNQKVQTILDGLPNVKQRETWLQKALQEGVISPAVAKAVRAEGK